MSNADTTINWPFSETEVLKWILSDKQILANSIHFALETAFPYPEHPFGQDVFVAMNTSRQKLGLSLGRKPGDIDLLIVPFTKSLLLDRTIAIETKIVRPTLKNPSRNSNAMGLRQTRGLLEDGFPFVGLLHIIIPEPFPDEWHWNIPLKDLELDNAGQLKDTGTFVKIDPFPLICAYRQEGRLKHLSIPHEAAYKAISISGLGRTGHNFKGCNTGEEKCGRRNPRTCLELVKRVGGLVEKNQISFNHIRWL